MNRSRRFHRVVWPSLAMIVSPAWAGDFTVEVFRLRGPGGAADVRQGSGLHFGRLADRHGLWVACDRNGEHSAGKFYYVSAATLARARPGEAILADEEFAVVAPAGEWEAFVEANRGAGRDVLEELRKRMTPGADRTDEPYLDLEAITLAPGIADPSQTHVYAVAEEPHSAVLELALEGRGERARARLVAVYTYAERPGEFGSVHNDGLEGLAWSGEPGRFYFAEEATRKLNDEPRSLQLFSLDPRLGVAELKAGRVVPEEPRSEKMTAAIRGCRKGRMQTLNALTVLRDGRVLAVDRNGGWIDEVDPRNGTARAWLNLYDLDGVNLREVLADFPRKRNMPYVSIEGLALDDAGAMWLVDDPAMPEGWRESCLVRISGPGLARGGASAPAGASP